MVARKLSMVFVALIAALVLVSFVQVSPASAAARDGSYNVPLSSRGPINTSLLMRNEEQTSAYGGGNADFVVRDGSFNVPLSSRGPIDTSLLTRNEEHTVAYGAMTETPQGFARDTSSDRPVSHR